MILGWRPGTAWRPARWPAVIGAVTRGHPGREIQQLAQVVKFQPGALFEVITNAQGIRYSHPEPALIGKPVYADPDTAVSQVFRTGRSWTGLQRAVFRRLTIARIVVPVYGPV